MCRRQPTDVVHGHDNPTAEGQKSGLAQTSAVKCENVYTLSQNSVLKTIGALPDSLMTQVDAALKASLALP